MDNSASNIDKWLKIWDENKYDTEPGALGPNVVLGFEMLEKNGYLRHLMPTKNGRARLRQLNLSPPKTLPTTKDADKKHPNGWICILKANDIEYWSQVLIFHSLRDALYTALKFIAFTYFTDSDIGWNRYIKLIRTDIKNEHYSWINIGEEGAHYFLFTIKPVEYDKFYNCEGSIVRF